MTSPTVTITVGGVPVSAMGLTPFDGDVSELDGSLYMMYAQATKGDQRHQWVAFPPAIPTLGIEPKPNASTVLLLKRTQEFKGNRSKWFHNRSMSYGMLAQDLTTYAEQGYALIEPLVIPLETDDYTDVWGGNTPHKALRAVDRSLIAVGLSIK